MYCCHTYLNSCNLSSVSPAPGLCCHSSFTSSMSSNPSVVPGSLLHHSTIDYASMYRVMTRFGLCLWVAGIMVWVVFFLLLGTNRTFSPLLPSSFTWYIGIYILETSMPLIKLRKINKQVQEKPNGAIAKPRLK